MQTDIEMIFDELKKAEKKHPGWPNDPIHAAGVLVEEAGELMQACIDYSYDDASIEKAAIEAAQTGAMAIRFLININQYKRIKTNGETT